MTLTYEELVKKRMEIDRAIQKLRKRAIQKMLARHQKKQMDEKDILIALSEYAHGSDDKEVLLRIMLEHAHEQGVKMPFLLETLKGPDMGYAEVYAYAADFRELEHAAKIFRELKDEKMTAKAADRINRIFELHEAMEK